MTCWHARVISPAGWRTSKRSLQIDPGYVLAHRLRGGLLSYLGANEKALVDLDALIKANPKDVGALKDRGGVFVRLGNFERASKTWTRPWSSNPAGCRPCSIAGRPITGSASTTLRSRT